MHIYVIHIVLYIHILFNHIFYGHIRGVYVFFSVVFFSWIFYFPGSLVLDSCAANIFQDFVHFPCIYIFLYILVCLYYIEETQR